ncbi:MAG: hypothetical protein DHS20C10_04680 [marine bacterium B5-7]|nr:MAG: hypothetical protein DHS20C10_04680 [marine bacterium B5-7]
MVSQLCDIYRLLQEVKLTTFTIRLHSHTRYPAALFGFFGLFAWLCTQAKHLQVLGIQNSADPHLARHLSSILSQSLPGETQYDYLTYFQQLRELRLPGLTESETVGMYPVARLLKRLPLLTTLALDHSDFPLAGLIVLLRVLHAHTHLTTLTMNKTHLYPLDSQRRSKPDQETSRTYTCLWLVTILERNSFFAAHAAEHNAAVPGTLAEIAQQASVKTDTALLEALKPAEAARKQVEALPNIPSNQQLSKELEGLPLPREGFTSVFSPRTGYC